MKHSPHPILLILLVMFTGISGCNFYGKSGIYAPPLLEPVSPLRVDPSPPLPPDPAPDETLYDPLFEDAATVVAWARPVAPENSFNMQYTADGQHLLYLTRHPGTRWTSLYSVPLAGGEPALLGTADVEEEIFYYIISPDGTRVIYYQLHSGEGLYSSSITGSQTIHLTQDKILEAAISPDGQWVVYWGGQEGEGPKIVEPKFVEEASDDYALYTVPALGGDPVRLGDGLTQGGSYKITPDSRYVLYIAAETGGAGAPVHLYRVPIEGGKPVQLDQGEELRAGGTFLISPDSQWVFFGNLYRSPIEGGTPEQLNPMADAGSPAVQFAYPPQISPDGQWLVFTAGERWENNVSLYSTPLAGGPVVQLNGPLGPTEDVRDFHISPDGQHVFYTQARREDEHNGDVYRVPIGGGAATAYPAWDGVYASPDGHWLIHTVTLANGGYDIYSSRSAGGTALEINVERNTVKLNTSVPANSAVAWFQVSPDSRTLIYATSKDAGGGMPIFDGLYAVSLAGGDAHELTGVDGSNRIFGFFFTPDGESTVAEVDYDGDGRYALYVYDIYEAFEAVFETSTLLAPPE